MRTSSVLLFLPGIVILAACSAQRTEPAHRDLTLLAPDNEALPAVVSARELGVTRIEPGPSDEASTPKRQPTPARTRVRPARIAADADTAATAPDPSSPLSEQDVAFAGSGAGRALEPGQSVTVLPAGSDGVAGPPEADPVIAPPRHDDDRCIPGRGEVMPRGGRGFPGRGMIPRGFRGRF